MAELHRVLETKNLPYGHNMVNYMVIPLSRNPKHIVDVKQIPNFCQWIDDQYNNFGIYFTILPY